MNTYFVEKKPLDEVALNILKKRYFISEDDTWEELTQRVVDKIFPNDEDELIKLSALDMIRYRYFVPNSPCLVNAGRKNSGLVACFVVDFEDSILDIYKTKLDFALIAKKGGGCGTTLSKLRPENSPVAGSSHGYAGGPIKFFDTICHDMEAMTQAGFREMAIMGVMSIYHPDILRFISSKETEGKLRISNISVMVDDKFMEKVKNNETYWTEFNGIKYQELNAREVFEKIVAGAWKNGEPGLLFQDRVNNSPYRYSGQEISAVNPCGEQPLPPNGSCNLGSLDLSRFVDDGEINYGLLALAVRLAVNFLDGVIDANSYPTEATEKWAKENRAIGLGILGLADYFLERKIAYGSDKSVAEARNLMKFIYMIAEEESIRLGEEFGVPEACKNLPNPRRNMTLTTVAPTGTASLLAGSSSGIEPVFSEITTRTDKTGTYTIKHPLYEEEYFRCAVSANGAKEVTWQEHILMQAAVQSYVDSGVSKTINFPNHTWKETIFNAFMLAWETNIIKGMTVYRNGSRQVEVLSPKNLKKDKCPVCGEDLIKESGCKHCSKCDFSVCEL